MKPMDRQKEALSHIADYARKAVEMSAETSLDQFADHWRLRLAILKSVEIIGEAAGRLGPEFEAAHPDIRWRKIQGMRNRLVHGYDEVIDAVVWQTVTEDLPMLLLQVEKILAEAS